MTNWDRIRKVIDADATIQNRYLGDKEGEACIIGGMALAMGFPQLPQYTSQLHDPLSGTCRNFLGIDTRSLQELQTALVEYYGVTTEDLYHLQRLNDQCNDTDRRRVVLQLYTHLRELEETPYLSESVEGFSAGLEAYHVALRCAFGDEVRSDDR